MCGSAQVGVDVERDVSHRDLGYLERRYLTQGEQDDMGDLISGEARTTRFTELWVLKEAYAKAIGLGLSMPFDRCGFRFTTAGVVEFDGLTEPSRAFWKSVAAGIRHGIPLRISCLHDKAREDIGGSIIRLQGNRSRCSGAARIIRLRCRAPHGFSKRHGNRRRVGCQA